MKKLAIIDDYERVALDMADWASLGSELRVDVYHDHISDENEIAKRLHAYNVVCIMRERTAFTRSLLQKLPNLEHLYTSGMRNWSIDLEAAKELNIAVTGTPTLPYPAAEHAWGLILALAKRIPDEDRATRAGDWGTGVNIGLRGRTLGVLGLGKLGAQVARIGQAFQMNVLAWSQNLTPARCAEVGATLATKRQIFRDSDFLTVHVHVGTRNRGLIGAQELGLMKPSAYLINTARGPIVEEQALIAALEEKRIAGAGLDVFDTEPLPPDHPLRKLTNTVITPHQGYVIRENYERFFQGAVNNLRAWLDGRIVNALS